MKENLEECSKRIVDLESSSESVSSLGMGEDAGMEGVSSLGGEDAGMEGQFDLRSKIEAEMEGKVRVRWQEEGLRWSTKKLLEGKPNPNPNPNPVGLPMSSKKLVTMVFVSKKSSKRRELSS